MPPRLKPLPRQAPQHSLRHRCQTSHNLTATAAATTSLSKRTASTTQQRRMELSSIRRCFITYRECNANTNSPTLYSNLHFNQRTRMGYDISRTKEEAHRGVSIHAPAWGATTFVALSGNPGLFQSTHPHGVRRCADSCQSRRRSFNPRTRMGCDIKHCLAMYRLYRFQSTHPHGVRLLLSLYKLRRHIVSIHAPAWGATRLTPLRLTPLKFQSTHPHGVRLSQTS